MINKMRSSYLVVVMLSWNLIKLSAGQQVAHPNLYFTASDVTTMRQQALSTHREIFARLNQAADGIKENPWRYLPPRTWNEFSSKWNEGYGNNFGALAMYCVLNEKDVHARDIAIQFFTAFVSLPNWRVKALMEDDVPVAHSLVAVATAYDFLYEYLDDTQRSTILLKIKKVTKELYQRSFKLAWGKQYIQNHIPTNFVAFLTGALVVEMHDKEATPWKERAHEMLNRTMFLLSQVADGSMEEGVAYGTYTTRSLTQYIFLAKRHLGVDLTDNIWLREHFWFMYRTILPGFRETVGIADSNTHWFYGPESQLVFLDNYVMRNGYGNWLASQIRKSREAGNFGTMSFSQRYCTLHTEFMFYDPSILEKEPPNSKKSQLHLFNDWGVVTYGGGILESKTENTKSTFLSFKAGVLHGEAVNRIARTKPYNWITGWRNFNPGHEHPDQGSFVFAPNGVPFITEALYGPKYTWLNNVLLFGPTNEATCSENYEGQLGDCGKWLDFKNDAIWEAKAEIVSASEAGGMVFMSGEMSKWYSSSLGLISVYRAVILLIPEVLLVIDHIGKKAESPVSYVGAFFHNRDAPFELQKDRFGETFGTIELNGKTYQVLWANSNGDQSVVRCQEAEYHAEAAPRKTHFLNITTNLQQTETRLAYVFAAPGNKVTRPRLDAKTNGVHASLEINGIPYHVAIGTNYGTFLGRLDFLGFDGFAKVEFGDGHVVRYGPNKEEGLYEHAQTPVFRKLYVSNTNLIVLFVWASAFALLLLLFTRPRRRLLKCIRRCHLVFIMAGLVLICIAAMWLTNLVL